MTNCYSNTSSHVDLEDHFDQCWITFPDCILTDLVPEYAKLYLKYKTKLENDKIVVKTLTNYLKKGEVRLAEIKTKVHSMRNKNERLSAR